MDEDMLDCLIIGGGPAGLTAAIYCAVEVREESGDVLLCEAFREAVTVAGMRGRLMVHIVPRRLAR